MPTSRKYDIALHVTLFEDELFILCGIVNQISCKRRYFLSFNFSLILLVADKCSLT